MKHSDRHQGHLMGFHIDAISRREFDTADSASDNLDAGIAYARELVRIFVCEA